MEILEWLKASHASQQHGLVGVDCEWKPLFLAQQQAAAALLDVHPFEGREVVTVGSLVELRYVNEFGRDILTTEMLVPAAAWCP